MKYDFYEKQVRLLLKVLPIVATEKIFALKGGTAINFFIRDLPRLSVDIDLTYIPLESRELSILNINEGLSRISNKISSLGLNFSEKINAQGLKKLNVYDKDRTSIKIEPNYLLRGTVLPVEKKRVVKAVSDIFSMSASINVLNFNELYAGKICSALDRQHPRDLFDVKLLIESEGLTRDILDIFIIYLISHNRPLNEMLNPNFSDIKNMFEREFKGMTNYDISLEDLINTRLELVDIIKNSLTKDDKEFLLSFKKGNPDWSLSKYPDSSKLPSVSWKLSNIKKMSSEKHKEQLLKLTDLLDSISQSSN